jgi:hypothetical protein
MRIIDKLGQIALLGVTAVAAGQGITVTNSPVAPGAAATIVLDNTGPGAVTFVQPAAPLHAMQTTGELTFPLHGTTSQSVMVTSNSVTTLFLNAPATGPGSSGSYVLHYAGGNEAVTRLDVGAASGVFPTIHCWPGKGHDVFAGHGSPALFFGIYAWKFANTGTSAHVFSEGDDLYVFDPSASSPVQAVDLEGMVVPPGGVLSVSLNLSSFTPGPYRVLAVWADPGTDMVETRTHGIRRADSRLDMHFPAGRVVPMGGSLPTFLAMSDFIPQPQGSAYGVPYYLFVLSSGGGSTHLSATMILPVPGTDPLVIASILTDLGGHLQNNVGQALPDLSSGVPSYIGLSTAPYCTIVHPGLPSLSGSQLHAAALAFDPVSGLLGTSQPEEIILE